ncbi:MAG TPA: gluconate 2-dehydrogenase subunit 3 family protein [Kiritimatiellia bacterium]|jgi:hypothetical protein|nr:gluconate 2-dehydrogenase subunit 3 family protein [Kiritimatiellia bacterium]
MMKKRNESTASARMTRKAFLGLGGVVAGGFAAGWFGVELVEYMGSGPETPWRSLTEDEAKEFDRLAEELIPADEFAPGAHDAKVVRFIDWQMAPGKPYEKELETYRKFLALTKGMGAAEVEKKFPDFFATLLKHVRQGYYAHPVHGGNFAYASYRLVGLPGPTVTGRNVPGKESHL